MTTYQNEHLTLAEMRTGQTGTVDQARKESDQAEFYAISRPGHAQGE